MRRSFSRNLPSLASLAAFAGALALFRSKSLQKCANRAMSLFRQLARKFNGPRCHLTPEEKAWVERRMLWLKEQFGSEPIRRPPLDPTSEVLPRKWDGSYTAGADLFNRLCGFMIVDPATVRLHFYSKYELHKIDSPVAGETQSSGPAGLYVEQKDRQGHMIALEEEALNEPAQLAATICHELAHVHLIGAGRLKPDEQDGEPLTDLLTVYFGAGIFSANSAFQFSQWQLGNRGGWSASKQGYLSEPLFGYALACFSWYRGDLEAQWRRYLRQNIEYFFSDSMHFLATTSNTTIPFNGA
jgi:hypothetical protein